MKDIFRITIEQYNHKTSVEVARPDVTLTDAMELIERALLGAGYTHGSIDDYFNRQQQ